MTNSLKSIDVSEQVARLDFTSLLSLELGKHLESLKRFNRVEKNRGNHKWGIGINH